MPIQGPGGIRGVIGCAASTTTKDVREWTRGDLLALVACLLSLVLLSFVAFNRVVAVSNGESLLFYSFDGSFLLSHVRNFTYWNDPGLFLPLNILHSNANVFYPLNANLIPGYVLPALVADDAALPILSMTIFAAELFLSTCFLGACIGIGPRQAMVAAWLIILAALPFFAPTLLWPTLWGMPHWTTVVASSSMLIGLYHVLGRGSPGQSMAIVALMALLVGFMFLAIPQRSVLAAPSLAIYGLASLGCARNRSEVLTKLGGAALLVIAFFGAGYVDFLRGQFTYSVPLFFADDLYHGPAETTWFRGSILFHGKYWTWAGPLLVTLSCAGALLLIVIGRKGNRWFAAGHLFFVAVLLVAGYLDATQTVNLYHIGTYYFEVSVWPLYACFTVVALTALGRLAIALARSLLPRLAAASSIKGRAAWLAPVALVVLPWGVLFDSPHKMGAWTWPPGDTPVIELLRREIGLSVGSTFRGRVATFTGYTGRSARAYSEQIQFDSQILAKTGNEHRMYGLWYNNIPTLGELTSAITPPFHFVTSRLLNDAGVKHTRVGVTITKPNVRILQNLGVRFVIDDKPLGEGAELRTVLEWDKDKGRKLYLYELPDPNLGTYSPTRTFLARDAGEALARMAAETTDFRREAVVHVALPGDLVPATSSGMWVHRGYLEVRARSPGRSIVVLPVEFSRCLDFEWRSPRTGDARVFRANLNQTGVLFSGVLEGTITFRYGPFHNRNCRLEDARDAERLDLRGAA
ncbi:MAG: hypothetical protein IIA72_10095 [Proteobacteria bacterium]|nr:hypothetical protein [Pseudomonadota bacterium]